mmetsp:Transcript_5352/g.15296  ORF Transcript_5352/g.15296 Transcript_5352/m.15296 type:complete len:323 (+) Transcript_5352:2284-3252(+)
MNDLLGLVKDGSGSQRAPQPAPSRSAEPAAPAPTTAKSTGFFKSLSIKNSKTPVDIEAPMDSKNASDMDQFYAQVSVIKALMADIKDLQARLEANNERTKTAVRTAQVHELREKMQQDANTISKEAEQIKSYLKQLDAENAAAMKKKGQGKGTASERTRTAVTGALKKKLKESMDEFQELRERLMADYRETVERRVYTVTGEHASEEQIDNMIDEGEGEMIFQKAIMEQGRGYVMDTVAELRERRDAVLELERSLLELHQVFLDMAVLVEAQGQMIDNIENQVWCCLSLLCMPRRLIRNNLVVVCCCLSLEAKPSTRPSFLF